MMRTITPRTNALMGIGARCARMHVGTPGWSSRASTSRPTRATPPPAGFREHRRRPKRRKNARKPSGKSRRLLSFSAQITTTQPGETAMYVIDETTERPDQGAMEIWPPSCTPCSHCARRAAAGTVTAPSRTCSSPRTCTTSPGPRPSAPSARSPPLPAGRLERQEPWGVWGGQLLLNGRIVTNKRPRGRPPKRPRPELVVDEVPLPPYLAPAG